MPITQNPFITKPLIEMKTNLTSLKYGGDQIGGGWSGQPYIQTPIDPIQQTPQQRNLISVIRNSTDFPIRGGALDYNAQAQTVTQFGEIDKRRIKAFLESKPRGSAFIQKQVGLQLSNPNIQTGQAFFSIDSIFGVTFPSFTKNTKIYNGGRNTLAQVGFSGTGIHAVRHGIIPIDLKTKYYSDIVGAERLLNSNTVQAKNRLLILNHLKMTEGNTFTPLASTNINEINNLGISRNKLILFDYLTGPGSVYGIGKTTIKRYDDTRQAGIDWAQSDQVTRLYSTVTTTYDTIKDKTVAILDEYSRTTEGGSREQIYSLNWGNRGGSDLINKTFNKLITNQNEDPWNSAVNDMIKFGFECMNNSNVDNSIFLQFRAYLDGGITDNNSAQWNSFKYAGRGEDFYTYQGFTRQIAFSFKIAAQSEEELKTIYNKLNYLISQVYPDYSSTSGLMRAPIVKLTIGDYLYRVPGVLDSVNVTIDNTYSWDITDGQQVPQVLNVAIAFKPILSELPQRSTSTKNAATLIGNKLIEKSQKLAKLSVGDATDATNNTSTQQVPSNLDASERISFDRILKKPSGFETKLEKNRRVGDMYEYGVYQRMRGAPENIIGTTTLPTIP